MNSLTIHLVFLTSILTCLAATHDHSHHLPDTVLESELRPVRQFPETTTSSNMHHSFKLPDPPHLSSGLGDYDLMDYEYEYEDGAHVHGRVTTEHPSTYETVEEVSPDGYTSPDTNELDGRQERQRNSATKEYKSSSLALLLTASLLLFNAFMLS